LTRLLLDTHALIWWLQSGDELTEAARDAVGSPRSEVIVSAASIWEASIKRAKGRLQAPSDLSRWVRSEGFVELSVGFEHAELAGALPWHHADPFDRLIIAQARIEGLTIVTRDKAFEAYGVPLLGA
jgi:PIN domain nuclease of toxin-antitoxin system